MKRAVRGTISTVLITGAATGIGEICALTLAQQGYHVFAGVRRAEDGIALQQKASGNLSWLLLDVTETGSIDAAVNTVASAVGDQGLSGLINNAGVSGIGPLEFLPISEVRKLLEVNVVGLLAVTQAFLPLLRKTNGRIVNLGSISGRLALPFGGGYSLSKFAVEALTDELRFELRPWGLHVALVEPGGIATPLWEKSRGMADRLLELMPEEARGYYGPVFPTLQALAIRWGKHGTAPGEVAKVVLHALTAPHPKTRYFVGCRAGWSSRLLTHLPDRWRDWLIASQLPRYASVTKEAGTVQA
jgi:NAD(P)-dependent dehydrogenase (short-subunit alcohol dehydrogenase family)